MRKRLLLFFSYGLFWLLYFIFVKAFFLVFNIHELTAIRFADIAGVFIHGFSMDLSTACILLAFPALLICITFLFNLKIIPAIIHVYTVILLILITFLVVSDAELYDFWGFRLDMVAITYLKTPKEAFASVSWWIIVRQLFLGLVIFLLFLYIYRKKIVKMSVLPRVHPVFTPVMLLLTAALIIPIRGGFGVAPMNTGRAYFSSNNFLNHSAINVAWNLGFSISERKHIHENYNFMKTQEADSLVQPMLNQNLMPDSVVLNTKRPNIIIFVLESFTAKAIGSLGGISNITPNINRLSKEGLLFTNFFANGDRSDKGLVAILSGYPAQPVTSIMVYSNKTESLPKLFQTMNAQGYATSYYYGGDINFANMRSFLLESHVDHIVCQGDYRKSRYDAKWGSPDHVTLNRFYNDICKSKQPFFDALFTLSSHEPFDVPSKFMKGSDSDSKMLNAIHYTDSCLGVFIDKAKTQAWWKNTLIVMVADHGHRSPGNTPNHVPLKFRIPMLWLGGALKEKGVVSKYATQMDIASTILHQMGLKSNEYKFSKDIFSSQPGFVFYCYDNGFGYLKKNSTLVYDCGFKKIMINNTPDLPQELQKGKAYLQYLYSDFNKR